MSQNPQEITADKAPDMAQAPPTYASATDAAQSSTTVRDAEPMAQPKAQPSTLPPQQPPAPQPAQLNTTPLANLSSSSAPVACPKCSQRTMTQTEFTPGGTTNAWAAVLCLLVCLGCIPYCVDGTKDVVHRCGSCGARLATWHRSGRTEVHAYAA